MQPGNKGSKEVWSFVVGISETASVDLQNPDSASLIRENSDVVLRCHVDGSGEIRVDWYLNGERLQKSDHLTPHGKRLHLRAVTPRDNGVYRCSANNRAGMVHSTDNFVLAIPGTGSCHERQKPQARTPRAPIRNHQTRKVANAKGLNCNTKLT